MGLFGNLHKGANMMGEITNLDMPPALQTQQPQMPAMMQQPQQNMPPALQDGYGKRPLWKDILGGVLDTIAIASGHKEGGYWSGVQDLRDKTDKEREFQRQMAAKAEAERSDWLWKQQYERENPDPTAFMQNFGYWKQQPGNEGKSINDYMTLAKPQWVPGEYGGGQYVTPPGTEAPDELPADFTFGSAGGPARSAPGGFRR